MTTLGVTTGHLMLTEAPGADGPTNAVVYSSAHSLDRHVSALESKIEETAQDRNLTGQGRAEKRTDLAQLAVDGVQHVGNFKAVDEIVGRRDLLRATVGNRFHLTKTEGSSPDDLPGLYREIRAELRTIERDTNPDRQEVERAAIISKAIEAKDKNLLGALFDGGTVSPTLAILTPTELDALGTQLFEAWEPEAAAELAGLESAISMIRSNRGRVAKTVAKLAGVEPELLGIAR